MNIYNVKINTKANSYEFQVRSESSNKVAEGLLLENPEQTTPLTVFGHNDTIVHINRGLDRILGVEIKLVAPAAESTLGDPVSLAELAETIQAGKEYVASQAVQSGSLGVYNDAYWTQLNGIRGLNILGNNVTIEGWVFYRNSDNKKFFMPVNTNAVPLRQKLSEDTLQEELYPKLRSHDYIVIETPKVEIPEYEEKEYFMDAIKEGYPAAKKPREQTGKAAPYLFNKEDQP